jgi:hypothetical protein
MSKDYANLSNFALRSEKKVNDGRNVLNVLSSYQREHEVFDTDRCLNEIRDGIAAGLIGFDRDNIDKNGFDCANSKGELLEVKSVNCSSSSWSATFNDTTEKKALSFKEDNVYLQVPLWVSAAKISCFLIGSNPEIGEFLLSKVKHYNENREDIIRCTQSLPITKLYKEFGFKIVAVDYTKEKVVELLKKQYPKAFSSICVDDIMSVEEYNKFKASKANNNN